MRSMYSTEAYARKSEDGKFEKISIERNECGADDVEFDILFCGVCHTDVHLALNQTWSTDYPIVPGHELAGKVSKIGSNVTKFSIGDKVGIGCISDSCMTCSMCHAGEEQYCEGGMTSTYNAQIEHGHLKTSSGYTFGGYSRKHTIHQRYVIKIPAAFPLEYAGPIFCAGITTYSPLKHFGAGNGGKRVGIIGIGGLGQMGIRLAVALGNHVTAISTSPGKESTCKQLGAEHFIVSSDVKAMKSGDKSLDLILNTISASHQCGKYLSLLATGGTLVQLGIVLEPHQVYQSVLMYNRNSIAGSLIGGVPETQELINFCAQKDIKPEIEVITSDRLDQVFELLDKKNDSVKRYVLDISKSV